MEELIEKFHLPKYVKGKSFADASSMIMDKFRERKDPESKRTMTELLDRLRQAQEFVKEQNKTPEERQQEQIQMQEQQMQQEQPQEVNPQMEGQPQLEQQMQQPQQTQFAEGGLMDYISKNKTNQYNDGGLISGMPEQGPSLAGGIGMATTGLKLGTQAFGKADVDISGDGGEERQSGVMSAIGGAAKGAQAGMTLGSIGAGVGAVLGAGAGILGANKHNKALLKASSNKIQRGRNQALNTFADGGYMIRKGDTLGGIAKNNNIDVNVLAKMNNIKDINKINAGDSLKLKHDVLQTMDRAGIQTNLGANQNINTDINTTQPITTSPIVSNPSAPSITNDKNSLGAWLKTAGNNIGNTAKTVGQGVGDAAKVVGKGVGNVATKTGKFLNENKSDILRYSPTAINAFQLARLPKAEVERLNRLDNRYKPDYADEAALQNIARENYNMTSQALSGASGGSTSALRSNILGAGLNRNKALSNAYLKADDINRNEYAKAQQFNLDVDRVNLQQSNSEKDINARNRAARDNEKSKLLSGIGTDLGGIGKEEKYKDIIEKVSGYDKDGKLITAKKAKREAAKDDRALKRKSRQIKRNAKKSPINAIQRNDFNLYNGLKTYNV